MQPSTPIDDVRLIALEVPDPAQGAVDLVLGVLSDRAGVVEDRVGLTDVVSELVPLVPELADDQLAIEQVHLAADRLDVELSLLLADGIRHTKLLDRRAPVAAPGGTDSIRSLDFINPAALWLPEAEANRGICDPHFVGQGLPQYRQMKRKSRPLVTLGLSKLFTEKQAAFELQKPKDGAAVDPKLRQDFQTKHQNFLEVKAKYDELKANGSTESIQRHRESLDEANAALQQARQEQPAKLAAAQTEIDTLNQQLTALKTQRLAIEDQVKPLIET